MKHAWKRRKNHTGIRWRNLNEREHLVDTLRWRDNNKMELKQIGLECMDQIDLGPNRDQWGGCSKHGNAISIFENFRGCFVRVNVRFASPLSYLYGDMRFSQWC